MQLHDKSVVITGAANGIGRAMAHRFASERPRGLMLADREAPALEAVAAELGAHALVTNVASEREVTRLADEARRVFGRIDLFCSNAGLMGPTGGLDLSEAEWRETMDVNFMSLVHVARAVVPGMLEHGGGYLLVTVSAAGLLTQVGAAPYSVSKHAALAFAEWLAITYGDAGLRVSALCPQGVRTRFLEDERVRDSFLKDNALSPEEVADAVVQGLEAERFLILPHPEVAEYFRRKAADYDRWLSGMRKLHARSGIKGG